MSRTMEMIRSHPRNSVSSNGVPEEVLATAIDALYRCAQTCTACADACLAESDVADLAHCIRTDLDCADVCLATAQILTRKTDTNWTIVRSQVETCIRACQVCAADCQQHANHHEHCRICAEACTECEEACQQLLGSLPS